MKDKERIETLNLAVRIRYDQMLVYRRWVELYQANKRIADYFHEMGFKRVAVYGMADIGVDLVNELLQSDIEVVYAVDQKRAKSRFDVEIRDPQRVTSDVDVIVVTPITYFSSIYDMLNKKLNGQVAIIGIDEVIAHLLVGDSL